MLYNNLLTQNFPMPLIEVYAHPEVRRYKSSIISCAVLFQLAVFAIILVVPFIIAYRTYGKSNIFILFSTNHIYTVFVDDNYIT